jgi:hypothetical protein
MIGGQRPIDAAMGENRPAKAVVRQWWVDQIRDRKTTAVRYGVPVYMTLPGAEGRDIRALIDAGVIAVTEAGGITDEDSRLLVAFESNMQSLGALKKNFPNLDVQGQTVEAYLGGQALDNYPSSASSKQRMRACVVNLDYNRSWKPDATGTAPPMRSIEKIAQIHTRTNDRPSIDWCLALTLHAQLNGPPEALEINHEYLREQAEFYPAFKDVISVAAPWLLSSGYYLTGEGDERRIQATLMLLVSAKLARLIHQGWDIVAVRLGAYGHDTRHAPMVTFMFSLSHSPTVLGAPLAAVGRFYESMSAAATSIARDGTVRGGWPLDPVAPCD